MQGTRWVYAFLFFSAIGFSTQCIAQSGPGASQGRALHIGIGPSFEHSFNYGLTYDWVQPNGMIAARIGVVKAERQLRRTRIPKERNLDFALMYGWRHAFVLERHNEILSVSAASGIALARFIRRTDELLEEPAFNCIFCAWRYASENENLAGVALELRIIFQRMEDDFGISLSAWGNLNRRHAFGGILFSVYLGS